MLNLYIVHAHREDVNLSRWVTAANAIAARKIWFDHIKEDGIFDPEDFDLWIDKAPAAAAEPGVHDNI